MMEKAYSLFLCVLLILVLFLPSTAAGRALLQTAETEAEGGYHGGNDGSKMGVTGSHSSTAPSRTGVSSPSKPTPGRISYSALKSNAVCSKERYAACIPRSNRKARCGTNVRNCK